MGVFRFTVESPEGEDHPYAGTGRAYWVSRPEDKQIKSVGWMVDLDAPRPGSEDRDSTRSIMLSPSLSDKPGARATVIQHRSTVHRMRMVATEAAQPRQNALIRISGDPRVVAQGNSIGTLARFSFTVDQWMAADANPRHDAQLKGKRVTAQLDNRAGPLETAAKSLVSHLEGGEWTPEQYLMNAFVEANMVMEFFDEHVIAMGEMKLDVIVSPTKKSFSGQPREHRVPITIGQDGNCHSALDRQTIAHEFTHGLVDEKFMGPDTEISQ